jgi:hypothetical protein
MMKSTPERAPRDFCVPCFDVFAKSDWQTLADIKKLAPKRAVEEDSAVMPEDVLDALEALS